MRCLVTGATGFVGGHLCERLRREGHEVFALARSPKARRPLESIGAQVLEGSLESSNVFARVAQQIDVVFHLAAITKAVRIEEFTRINVDGTARLIEGLERGGFRGRFVYLGSLAAGGPAIDGRPRAETDADAPVSEYGRTKLAGEKLVFEAGKRLNWTCVSLRPGAIYGPREHEILELLKPMAKPGIAVRFGGGVTVQLTHVTDVVEALILALQADDGRRYIVTDEVPYAFDDVVRLAAEALGHPVRIIGLPLGAASVLAGAFDIAGRVVGKPLSPLNRDKVNELRAGIWLGTSQLITRELGWKTTVPFDRGLRETIAWYRENNQL